MHFWGHLKTVAKHRWLVMVHCFKVGLIRQGLTHDLSKFSPTEFWIGVRYYKGTYSPNKAERETIGYSTAWMHHKGRNRHHFEYWSDLRPGTRVYSPVPMPTRYLVEMVMDRIAACKTYNGKAYTNADPLAYLDKTYDASLMHEETERKLRFLLTILAEQGEKAAFAFIREHVLRGEPFAEEDAP